MKINVAAPYGQRPDLAGAAAVCVKDGWKGMDFSDYPILYLQPAGTLFKDYVGPRDKERLALSTVGQTLREVE